jgi:para-nitrobenzyl esterase
MELIPSAGGRGGDPASGGTRAAPALSFTPNIDGYFLPKPLTEIFHAGEQAKVPLLAGTNSEEQNGRSVLGQNEATGEGFKAAIQRLYGDNADQVLKVYAPTTPEEVMQAATDLATARFIAHGTWKWTELQAANSGKPVYRYFYTKVRPPTIPGRGPAPAAGGGRGATGGGRGAGSGGGGGAPAAPRGAGHSVEIQYAMGNLDLDDRYAWDADDRKVSETMQSYFANFIKTGNPNGPGLPEWPAYNAKTGYLRERIGVETKSEPEPDRERYQVLDAMFMSRQ